MTDQDRDIIFRVASQDLAGVLEIVTAVASGKVATSPKTGKVRRSHQKEIALPSSEELVERMKVAVALEGTAGLKSVCTPAILKQSRIEWKRQQAEAGR